MQERVGRLARQLDVASLQLPRLGTGGTATMIRLVQFSVCLSHLARFSMGGLSSLDSLHLPGVIAAVQYRRFRPAKRHNSRCLTISRTVFVDRGSKHHPELAAPARPLHTAQTDCSTRLSSPASVPLAWPVFA